MKQQSQNVQSDYYYNLKITFSSVSPIFLLLFCFCFLHWQTHPRQSESLSTAVVFSKVVNFLNKISFTHLIDLMTSSITEEKRFGKNIGGG